jgi:sulfide:quinone oxidoreductase
MTHHVVIAGGGVGALEGLLALQHLAAGRLEISLLTASRHLTYRAVSVAEPFGGDPSPHYEWERIARDREVRWIADTLQAVDTDARQVETRDGPPVRYDALLLALGARPEPALRGTIPFAGPRDVLAIREAIEGLQPGRRHAIAFVAPSDVAWTLPLYELALMTGRYGRTRGLDLHIEVVTRESDPLDVFGPAASAEVARRLAAAGIGIRTGTFAEEYDEHKLWLELEGPLEADLVIALPRLRGPAVPGLPNTPQGFVAVDPHCRVRGVDRVWAVGDMTTRPLKQGGLATQQADVAAADIAANVAGADVPVRPYKPRLQGMLLTGDDPIYLERRGDAPSRSEASSQFLWWPAHKVAGRHVGRYLDSLKATPTN